MRFKTSTNGLKLITDSEGCVLHAYADATGTLTIGYGHTLGVVAGQVITKMQALDFLKSDLDRVENFINQYELPINQNQFDALVDLLFNCGTGVFKNFVPLILAFNTDAVCAKLGLYVFSKGVKLPGLVTRRAKEVELYKKKI